MVKNLPAVRDTQPLGQEDPLSKKQPPTPIFLPGKPSGQGILVGYSLRDHKELDMTE